MASKTGKVGLIALSLVVLGSALLGALWYLQELLPRATRYEQLWRVQLGTRSLQYSYFNQEEYRAGNVYFVQYRKRYAFLRGPEERRTIEDSSGLILVERTNEGLSFGNQIPESLRSPCRSEALEMFLFHAP